MYLTFNTQEQPPAFYFNFTVDDGQTSWEFVPTRDLPPCAVPRGLPVTGSILEVIGGQPPQSMASSALKAGMNANLEQLDQIIIMLKVKLPVSGSGEGGNLIKIDKATAIIKHVFPNDPAEEQQRMIFALTGRSAAYNITECPASVISAVASLDPENGLEFRRVIHSAKQLLKQQAKSGPAHESPMIVHEGQAEKWKCHTPKELYHLLPGQHSLPQVYLKIYKTRFQGVCQSRMLSCSAVELNMCLHTHGYDKVVAGAYCSFQTLFNQ